MKIAVSREHIVCAHAVHKRAHRFGRLRRVEQKVHGGKKGRPVNLTRLSFPARDQPLTMHKSPTRTARISQ